MKRYFFCLAFMGLVLASQRPAFAESFYIIDQIVVALRAEPSSGAESKTSLRTGTKVEVLENAGAFLRVRTEKGEEGFIPAQYLTSDRPGPLMIEELRKENEALKARMLEVESGKPGASPVSAQPGTDKALVEELAQTREKLKAAEERFAALEKNSQDVVLVMTERQGLQHENETLAAELEDLKGENNLILRTAMIKWFIAGAGVFFFGWVIGKISRKKRRNY